MKKKKLRNVGIDVIKPKKECSDEHCPFHSSFNVHGRSFEGFVRKKNTHKTATITIQFFRRIPKYERYEKKLTRIHVHNPPCQDAQVGDFVKVVETRPISKTKNFVIVSVQKK